MTDKEGNGTDFVRKARHFDGLGAIKLLPSCKLNWEQCTRSREILTFSPKNI